MTILSLDYLEKMFTFLFSTVGLRTALANCRKEPPVAQIGASSPSCELEGLSSLITPSLLDPDDRTVGILDMLCLRSRANSSFQPIRNAIREGINEIIFNLIIFAQVNSTLSISPVE